VADFHQRGRNAASCEACYVEGMSWFQLAGSIVIAASVAIFATAARAQGKGIMLEDLTWQEAEKVLTPESVVVIPIGAESKEHGPHLKLKNDWLMAEYFKREVLKRADVVVAPTVNYHYYPAFVEYPGSTTLRLETARDLMIDVCRSLARYGPRRFYALNTGVSTMRALRLSADALAADGITLRYTDVLKVGEAAEKQVKQEEGGTHADEIETSIMLFIAPATVDMKKAVKDYHPSGKGGLTRTSTGDGDYSASGVFGDATMATRRKGEILVHAMLEGMLKEIEELRAVPAR
jgi:creatinine amidohydrolase